MLVDGLDCFGRHFQGYPTILLRNEKALFLQIREESALSFIVRVRNIVPHLRSFSGDFTNSGHTQYCLPLKKGLQISGKRPQLSKRKLKITVETWVQIPFLVSELRFFDCRFFREC